MLPWSMLSGAPRFGDTLPGHRLGRWKGSVQVRVRAARRAAFFAFVLVLWAGADLASWAWAFTAGRFEDMLLLAVAPAGVVALALGAVRLASARKQSRPKRSALTVASFAVATVALSLAVGALTLPDAPFAAAASYLPGALVAARGSGPAAAIAAPAALLLVAPFVLGLHAHANALGIGIAGTAPRVAPYLKAWRAQSTRDLLEPRSGGLGRFVTTAPRHWLTGFSLPGLLATDVLVTLGARTATRLTGQVVDRVHLDVDLRTLAEALSARGYTVEGRGRVLVVEMPRPSPTEVTAEADEAGFRRIVSTLAGSLSGHVPDQKTELVRVRAAVLYLPPVESSNVLNLRGPPRAVRRLRRLIETELLFVGTFAWSMEARRMERRLNSLAVEAAYASTMEERGVLLEEATHLERIAHARAFLEEEWTLLAAWKAVRLRAILQDRILSAPPDVKKEGRLVAPGAAIPPQLDKLVAAGGLAAVRGVVFVPHFIVPVQLSWGEPEFVVNAVTGKVDRRVSRTLLDAVRTRGTRFLVDGGKSTQFIKRPVSTGAVYGEVRRVLRHELGYWGPIHLDEALVETIYVPFVDADGKFVNALTTKEAPEVKAALIDVLPLRSTL